MEVLFVLLFIGVFVAIVGFIMFMTNWTVHISMNKGQGKPYDWCTFKTFIKEFDKYKNNPKLYTQHLRDETSIFLDGENSESIVYLHADIIRFNEKCMILYPHSWLQYCIWKRRFTSNRQRGLWK